MLAAVCRPDQEETKTDSAPDAGGDATLVPSLRPLCWSALHMQVVALDNGFLTPAMGWNPWNYYGVRDNGVKRFSPISK